MRAEEFDQHKSDPVVHVHDESIFVAANIEHDAVVPDEAGAGIVLLDVVG